MATVGLQGQCSIFHHQNLPTYLSPDAILTGLVITKEVAGVTFQDTDELTLKEAHCQSLRVYRVILIFGGIYHHLLKHRELSVRAIIYNIITAILPLMFLEVLLCEHE